MIIIIRVNYSQDLTNNPQVINTQPKRTIPYTKKAIDVMKRTLHSINSSGLFYLAFHLQRSLLVCLNILSPHNWLMLQARLWGGKNAPLFLVLFLKFTKSSLESAAWCVWTGLRWGNVWVARLCPLSSAQLHLHPQDWCNERGLIMALCQSKYLSSA